MLLFCNGSEFVACGWRLPVFSVGTVGIFKSRSHTCSIVGTSPPYTGYDLTSTYPYLFVDREYSRGVNAHDVSESSLTSVIQMSVTWS